VSLFSSFTIPMLTEPERASALPILKEMICDMIVNLSFREATLFTPAEDCTDFDTPPATPSEAEAEGEGGAGAGAASPKYSPTSPAYSICDGEGEGEGEGEGGSGAGAVTGAVTEGASESESEGEAEEEDDEAEEAEEEEDDEAEDGDEQPSKRSRQRVEQVKGVDCCTMAVDAALKITDTGKMSSVDAHSTIMKAVRDASLMVQARDCRIAFLSVALAAVSTPFAAFYLDMDPSNPRSAFMVFREAVMLSLQYELSGIISSNHLLPKKVRDELSEEMKYKPRFAMTPTQRWIDDRVEEVTDRCMKRIVEQLAAVREKWKARGVSMIRATMYGVEEGDCIQFTRPGMQCPKVSVTTMLLPADILPPAAAIPATTTHYSAYNRPVATHDEEPTIDTIKYDLTKFVFDTKPAMQIETVQPSAPAEIAVSLVAVV
jgi:hypothetical protein